MHRWGWKLGTLLLLAMLAFACQQGAELPVQVTHLNHLPDAQYVGIEACRNCHYDKYSTFVECEMGRSFKSALLSNSVAEWDNIEPVYDTLNQFYYLPFAKGEELFLMEFRLNGKDTTYRQTQKLTYIVGSGQHTNSHIISENGYLTQAPLTWYAQKGKWDLPPGFEGGNNSRWFRAIGLECMTCHNAMPTFVEGSENQFTNVPHGIDCERCHGPGSLHVSKMLEGKYPELLPGAYDSTIVHPGKLSPELQFDICQRCHLQGVAVPEPGHTFMDFRPGMPLKSVMQVFIPRFNDGSFIMASHPDRLRQSICYQQSANSATYSTITCVTCHNPHVSVQTAGRSAFNEPCITCHQQKGAGACSLDQPKRMKNGNDCASCHMPETGSSDIPHVRIHDHKIQIPLPKPVAFQEQKEFIELVCLTSKTPDAFTMASGYIAYYEQFNPLTKVLDSANAYLLNAALAESGPLTELKIRYWFLRGAHAEIIKIAVEMDTTEVQQAWTAYRIGESFLLSGDSETAMTWFLRAVHLGPGYIDFSNKLASLLIRQGQLSKAWGILIGIYSKFSKDPSVLNNLGMVKVAEKKFQDAEQWFQLALSWDPDHPFAQANLASVYMNTGRMYLARQIAFALHKRYPQNAEYTKLWEICR